jgi:trk system potassium uptake protein TrkA
LARIALFGGTNPARVASAESVAVIGLGRSGQSLALEFIANDTEVLGIEKEMGR